MPVPQYGRLRGDMMQIDILVALFVGMMLGANFAVIILAFLEANHVDSDV